MSAFWKIGRLLRLGFSRSDQRLRSATSGRSRTSLIGHNQSYSNASNSPRSIHSQAASTAHRQSRLHAIRQVLKARVEAQVIPARICTHVRPATKIVPPGPCRASETPRRIPFAVAVSTQLSVADLGGQRNDRQGTGRALTRFRFGAQFTTTRRGNLRTKFGKRIPEARHMYARPTQQGGSR
jgi:hypothetical protein